MPILHATGALIGGAMAWWPSRTRHVMRCNLAHCFPAQSEQERRRLLRASLRATVQTGLEMGAFWCGATRRSLGWIRTMHGREHLETALARGKGVIIAAPHLGAWELVGLYCATRAPMTSLYRPPRMREMDALIRQARERTGARLVPTDAYGVRALYEALRRNEMVGILPDQEPTAGNGVFAPFFGEPAYTMQLLSRLAAKTEATVLFVVAVRRPYRGFDLHILPAPVALAATDREAAATALNQGVEECVRLAPEQYQWGYQRFRKRPEGAARIY